MPKPIVIRVENKTEEPVVVTGRVSPEGGWTINPIDSHVHVDGICMTGECTESRKRI